MLDITIELEKNTMVVVESPRPILEIRKNENDIWCMGIVSRSSLLVLKNIIENNCEEVSLENKDLKNVCGFLVNEKNEAKYLTNEATTLTNNFKVYKINPIEIVGKILDYFIIGESFFVTRRPAAYMVDEINEIKRKIEEEQKIIEKIKGVKHEQ